MRLFLVQFLLNKLLVSVGTTKNINLKTADLSILKSYVNPFVHCFYEWFVRCEKRIFLKFASPDWEDICENTLKNALQMVRCSTTTYHIA